MTYKKTWLSYLLWAVYTCLTGVMLANYAILFWQKKINDVVYYGTAFFVFFVFAAAAFCYFLIRKIFGEIRTECKISSHTKSLWEIFIALSLFFAGLLYRVSLYLQNITLLKETSYYQLATVKAEEIAEPMIHGASYLYTMCLSFVLSFLGNKIIVAVWMQILIQMITILLAFFAVRRLAGSIPACITMLVLALSSVYAGQILTMTPESLLFALYLMGMFIVGGHVKNVCRGCCRRSSAVYGALFSGFVIGFLTYLDAVSLTLVVFLFGFLTGFRETDAEQKCGDRTFRHGNAGFSVLLILAAIVAGILTFAGMLVLNAYSFYEETGAMAEALLVFYRTNFQIDYVFYRTEFSVVECFIIVILAAFLIAAFWNRRKVQNVSPWICLMLLLAPTPLTAQGVLSCQAWSVFIWSVLAGIGVQQSFVWETAPARERCTEEKTALMKETPIETVPVSEKEASMEPVPVSEKEASMEPVPVSGKETFMESVPVLDEVPVRKPRFLENPLPLPKKHEKRTMDYQYEVMEAEMRFDFEVDENDDFDI